MNEFQAGAISGIAQVLVGHPFDTIKIIKQADYKINLTPKNLLSGIKIPLLSHSIVCSLQFGIYEKLLSNNLNSFSSGFLSGLLCSPITYICDIPKINGQLANKKSVLNLYNKRGLFSTFPRDSIALSIYFSSYEQSKELGLNTFWSGAIAGVLNWSVTYPLDVIRTRQIVYNETIVESLKKKNFWKGFNSCIIRAFFSEFCGIKCLRYVQIIRLYIFVKFV